MLVPAGPIAFARKGWGLKGGAITSVVAEDSEGKPDVLCAQMICGAAFSGVKVLVLLPGGRGDDPAWQAVGRLLGGDDRRMAADVLREVPIRMYASGTGRDCANEAGLVYAPGLRIGELEEIRNSTSAAVLTSSDKDGRGVEGQGAEVIRIGGDFVLLDSEGCKLPLLYDPSGPIYRPVMPSAESESARFTT